MKAERVITIEADKKALVEAYEEALYQLYKVELQEAIDWFKAKYPKRTIEWKSGMGTCFWVLDGEILHWDTLTTVYTNRCYDMHYEDAIPDRKARRLIPLWNVFQSIHENSNVLGYGAQSSDMS